MIAPATLFPASPDGIDPILRRIVGRKVVHLVRAGRIAHQDAADFEQELYLRLLANADTFDPERSHPYAFATMLVARQAAKVLRDSRAQKRDPSRVARLVTDVAVGQDEFVHCELALDVTTVVSRLPNDLRLLAQRLKAVGISQIAREDEVSRKTIYRDVRQVRDRFEAAGFGSFTEES